MPPDRPPLSGPVQKGQTDTPPRALDPIVVLCPEGVPPALCAGMRDRLSVIYAPRPVQIHSADSGEGAAATVRFVPHSSSPLGLAGHIEWRTPDTVLTGPRLDLTVVDAPLQDAMLQDFGQHAITASPAPF